MADDQPSGGNGTGLSAGDLAQVVAPLAAVVAVLGSLATAGVISEAQRNHGGQLALAFGLIVGGATLWLVALVFEPGQPAERASSSGRTSSAQAHWTLGGSWAALKTWVSSEGRVVVRFVAIGLLAVGLFVATRTMINTQKDFERPAISATFDAATSVLNATVTDDGLASGKRLAVLMQGVDEEREDANLGSELTPDRHALYFALLGPGGDGKVNETVSVPVPKKYKLVLVKAWTGQTSSGCTSFEERRSISDENLNPGEAVGCLIIRVRS